mgnify:CR=1 FL=1
MTGAYTEQVDANRLQKCALLGTDAASGIDRIYAQIPEEIYLTLTLNRTVITREPSDI